jgi:hypothetical protein
MKKIFLFLLLISNFCYSQMYQNNGKVSYDLNGTATLDDINIQILTSNKQLTTTDKTYQLLDVNSAAVDRYVYLPKTAPTGKIFYITNNDDTLSHYTQLLIIDSNYTPVYAGSYIVDNLSPSKTNGYKFNGTKWIGLLYMINIVRYYAYSPTEYFYNQNYCVGVGSQAYTLSGLNSAIAIAGGNAPDFTTSIGMADAPNGTQAVGIGNEHRAMSWGVGIGANVSAPYFGVGVGFGVNELSNPALRYLDESVTLGYWSTSLWYGALSITASDHNTNAYGSTVWNPLKTISGKVYFCTITPDVSAHEVYLKGYQNDNARMKMHYNSSCKYTLNAIALSDSISTITKSWHCQGIISRDTIGSGTEMSIIQTTIDTLETGISGRYNTANWNLIITANETTKALTPTFRTGNANVTLQITIDYDYIVRKTTVGTYLVTP